eukprot:gnl/TRDRNA2_/TRDRNA2_131395_c0_seq1.p2 gnl/TRDRNA2_/TRDRNA2_131395_c0~~gnl/TRDRNA2_/TRDRNA2_131395_c0_seq1.p2  ORF type:complete len:211 (+),score=59.18 gnl/TRDRNA2_/TRDRNA2_131395_c0_seq1:968-1600(+)
MKNARDEITNMQASLNGVTAGLAEQLSSITEEMNKIRSELYGDQGIGGIAKELEKLKASGLGGLLGEDALAGLDNVGGGSAGSRPAASAAGSAVPASKPRERPGFASSTASTASSAETRRRAGGASAEPDRDLDAELKELQRKHNARKLAAEAAREKDNSLGNGEKLILLLVVLVCVYICSPAFRSSIKHVVTGLFEPEEDDDDFFAYNG